RGSPDGRGGTRPPLLVDRPADVAPDPGRGIGLRRHRHLEGLPVAPPGAPGSGEPAPLGPPADAPAEHAAGHLPGCADDLAPDPDRALPGLPADVPARRRPERRDQGLGRSGPAQERAGLATTPLSAE